MQEKTLLKIDWATHEAAKYACENWHYSKCLPPSKSVKIGAWENNRFIGVVVFGVGATNSLLKPYNLEQNEGCELVRLALTKHETPVSRIMSIAIRFLKKANPGLRLIVSFADPEEGHIGSIYQATNWLYCGRTEDCKYPVVNGVVTHPRQMSRLVKRDGLKRNSVNYVLKRGKYRYLMPLDKKMSEQIKKISEPYPKRASGVEADTSTFQVEEGGASPTDALQLNNESI